MEKFNINNIIEHYKLNSEELAKVLFPYIKYPSQALNRILRGEANLDTAQVENLASYIGVTVSDLWSVEDWGIDSQDNVLTFVKGNYKVKLNYGGVFLSVFNNEKCVYKEISIANGMTVEKFIDYINNIINKLKS